MMNEANDVNDNDNDNVNVNVNDNVNVNVNVNVVNIPNFLKMKRGIYYLIIYPF